MMTDCCSFKVGGRAGRIMAMREGTRRLDIYLHKIFKEKSGPNCCYMAMTPVNVNLL
jgi:hypothetical protein